VGTGRAVGACRGCFARLELNDQGTIPDHQETRVLFEIIPGGGLRTVRTEHPCPGSNRPPWNDDDHRRMGAAYAAARYPFTRWRGW
jgi:hypothetical protein